MASEHSAELASLIVGFCRSIFNFSSELKVKGLITVLADQSAITYVDIDETIARYGRGKLDAGPRNALQQWTQAQNSGQNERLQLQQLQSPVHAQRRSLPAPLQLPSQHFQMPQMPARVRMPVPQVQSPRMSSARMWQACVPQSVVRLKKMPRQMDPLQGIVSATPSVAKSFPAQGKLTAAGQSESHTLGARRDCFLQSGTVVAGSGDQTSDVTYSVGDAQLCNKSSSYPVMDKNNENTNGNQHLQIASFGGRGSGDDKEPRKKFSRKPSGQIIKKAQEKHPEGEEEEKEEEEEKNCKPHSRPIVRNEDSKKPFRKISKMPSGPKARKAQVRHSEEEEENKKEKEMKEEEEEEMEEEEEEDKQKSDKPRRRKVPKVMTTSLPTTAQDRETPADKGHASKATVRKRSKKVDKMDDAKMPKLEKETDNARGFWNTFVTKGAGKNKATAMKAK